MLRLIIGCIAIVGGALSGVGLASDGRGITVVEPWQVIPGTTSPWWDEAEKPCPCEDPILIEAEVLGPAEIQTTKTLGVFGARDREENCTILSIPVTLNSKYTTTHTWTLSAGLSATVEASVRSGLLTRVVAKGQVRTELSLEVGGAYSRSSREEKGTERRLTLLPCLGVSIEERHDEYFSEARQPVGDLMECIDTEPGCTVPQDPSCVLPIRCFEQRQLATATGDGDLGRTTRYDDYAPCEDDCIDPRDDFRTEPTTDPPAAEHERELRRRAEK
jgi:hypothetical protein